MDIKSNIDLLWLKLRLKLHLISKEKYHKKKDMLLLSSSKLFDAQWYIKQYPETQCTIKNAHKHYLNYGWKEGKNPSSKFNGNEYLRENQDVQNSQIAPLLHYIKFGKKEGRLCYENVVCHVDNKNNNVCTLDMMLKERFRQCHPLNILITPEYKEKRLNFITDSSEKSSLLGGVGTALILASQYCVKNNIELRIITREAKPSPSSYCDFMKLYEEKIPEKLSFYSDERRGFDNKYRLEVGQNEIFLVSSWWNARALKNSGIHNFFYIIQEVETFFYDYSDMRLMCEEIMNDKNIKFIVNSHWLWDYFKVYYPNIVENGVFFEPSFPKNVYNKKEFLENHSKIKIFFYARPFNSRNLYYTGCKVLDRALRENIIDIDVCEIYFVGNNLAEFSFSTGYKPILVSQMSWNKYREFIQNIDLALSLMYTPHPSYPPLDIAASGGVVVTNKFANKNSIEWSKNIIMSSLDEDSLVTAIKEGIKLARNTKKRQENYDNQTIPDNWQQSLSATLEFMENSYA